MFLSHWLVLLSLIPTTFSTNPGVKVELTEKGLEYERQLAIASIQQKLNSIKVPDMSGTERISPIGKVMYSLTNMHIVNAGLPKSAVDIVPGTGVRLDITDAFMSMNGNWRVKYLRIIKDSGSFDLSVKGLTISTSIAISSDETGRPTVSSVSCAANVRETTITFHGGASWLYNLFRKFIDKALSSALEKKICPLVTDALSDLNNHLKTLNVLAKVDEYAEIDYSMVSSPTFSNSSIVFNLKGEFYNIGKHQEPPFSAPTFSMLSQTNNMMYMGISAFTANSAAFVYNTAGMLSLYITDDMIPKSSLFHLNTKSFSAFIPQLEKQFPNMLMKLLVKTVKNPVITFQPDNVTIQALSSVTAYAIQPNATLSPLFVLNLESSVSARVFVSGMRIAGEITLNKMNLTLATSYVGEFHVKSLNDIFQMVLKVVILPKLNALFAHGYPLPTIEEMKLVDTKLLVLKDFVLIGTDVQFMG